MCACACAPAEGLAGHAGVLGVMSGFVVCARAECLRSLPWAGWWLQAEKQRLPFEALFRSLQKLLIEAAISEFQFTARFFSDVHGDIFMRVFAKSIAQVCVCGGGGGKGVRPVNGSHSPRPMVLVSPRSRLACGVWWGWVGWPGWMPSADLLCWAPLGPVAPPCCTGAGELGGLPGPVLRRHRNHAVDSRDAPAAAQHESAANGVSGGCAGRLRPPPPPPRLALLLLFERVACSCVRVLAVRVRVCVPARTRTLTA
jgi:hypothetical protein